MPHARYPHLFDEGSIKGVTMKNRLVLPSMCDNMSDREGRVTDQKVAYFRRRAEGGVGWINLGYAYITPRGRGCTYFQVGIYDDDLIPGLRRLTDTVHSYDVRMGSQIAHAGNATKTPSHAVIATPTARRRVSCALSSMAPLVCGVQWPHDKLAATTSQ